MRDAICQLSGEWPEVFLHVESNGFHGAINLSQCMKKGTIVEEAFKKWSNDSQVMIQLRWLDETGWKDFKKVPRSRVKAELELCRRDEILDLLKYVNAPKCEFRAVVIL